jgi:hypothetical protein
MKRMVRAFTLPGLCLTIGAAQISGQTTVFFRQFTTSGMERATTVAADGSGIYIAGNRLRAESREDSADIRKYDSRGSGLWTREVSPLTPGYLGIIRVAADNSGVYVVIGKFLQVSGHLVRKYSPDGAELWASRFGEIKTATGVAVAATGV